MKKVLTREIQARGTKNSPLLMMQNMLQSRFKMPRYLMIVCWVQLTTAK